MPGSIISPGHFSTFSLLILFHFQHDSLIPFQNQLFPLQFHVRIVIEQYVLHFCRQGHALSLSLKVSNNQHKTDQAWDWLKRIWIAWAIINGMGAFLAYVRPLFDGLATIQ